MGIAPARHMLRPACAEELIYASSYLDEAGEPVLRIWRSAEQTFFHLVYCDGTQFWLDDSCEHLWAVWPNHLSVENTLCYVLGPVFGLILRFRGVTCLHASAVAFEQGCVVFVGAEGAGKSTTAAALAKRGHAVLADDIAAVVPAVVAADIAGVVPADVAADVEDGRVTGAAATPESRLSGATLQDLFYVLPAYPHLCLWTDSAEMVLAQDGQLPRLSPNYDKLRLNLGSFGTSFAPRALPLAGIYLFTERAGDLAPRVTRASRKVSLMSLVANTYANNLLDKNRRAEEFSFLDRLLAAVPVRLLTPHEDPSRLEQLCDLLEEDFRCLRQAGSAA